MTHPAAFQGVIWGAAAFEEIADGAAPSHDALVAALGPGAGERWLDVATGTGPVALRAARAGADVTGLDVSPRMLETARRLAAAEGLPVRFDAGVAEELPYEDAAFDVVSSAQGVVFALDPRAAAEELARVCRPGGRLGLTCLAPSGLAKRLSLVVGAGGPALSWGDPEFVRALLGRSFALEFSSGDAPLRASSAEAAADLYTRCYPPLRFFAETLGCPDCAADMRATLVEIFTPYAGPAGLAAPRPYLLVLGTRFRMKP